MPYGYGSTNHPQNTTGGNYNTGASDNFVYPKNTNPGLPHYITFIAKRSYTSTTSTRGQQNGSVVLYMPPDALKTTYTQSIGDVDMGTAIQIAESSQSISQMQSDLDKVTGTVASTEVATKGGLNVAMDTAKAASAQLLATAFGQTAAKQAVEKATGKILNPHKAVVYQGPGGFRTFSYTFVLVPKSADEAKEIWKIVRFFKKRMHPGTGTGAGINDILSTTLTYPDEFEIQYYVNNSLVDGKDETKPLFKIHKCFMESFATDYTTSSLVSFLDDGNPLTTTISMSFKETQLLTKKDIDEGY